MRRWRFGIGQLMGLVVVAALVMAFARLTGFIGLIWLGIVSIIAGIMRWRNPRDPIEIFVMKGATSYFLTSAFTLPFAKSVFVRGIPILDLFQYPKLILAREIRHWLVERVIEPFGWSRGATWPDHIMASPYALVLTYAGIVGIVLGFVLIRTPRATRSGRWAGIMIGAALIDLGVVNFLAQRGTNLMFY